MSGVYKIVKVRMFQAELTNLRMYGSRRRLCRNAKVEKSAQVGFSKNSNYEKPYGGTGTVKLTGS